MKRNLYDCKGMIFKHFKGNLYLLLDFAYHTETNEIMVIYKALYGSCETYARPYKMFNEEVPAGRENPMGQVFRFELYEVEKV